MNWEDERWVKLYTRDSITWKLWGWHARFVMMSLIRKVDRAGVVDVAGHGIAGLAALLDIPADIVRDGMQQLTAPDEDGESTVVWRGRQLVLVHFIEAQEAKTSNTQRQRDLRERRRDLAKRGVTPRYEVSPAATRNLPENGDGTADADRNGPLHRPCEFAELPRLALPPPAEVVTPRVEERRKERAKTPRAKRAPLGEAMESLLAFFADRYLGAYGQRATRPARKLVDRLRALSDEHGDAEVRARITRAFTVPPSWPSPPYDLAAIVQHFDRFTVTRGSNGRVGRFEPADGLDYSSPWADVAPADGETRFDHAPRARLPWEDE